MATKLYLQKKTPILFLLVFLSLFSFVNIAVAQPVLSLTPVITGGLTEPMQLVNAGDGTGRVFIVQKGGTIKVYDAAFNFVSDFLTVTGITSDGERGLLSLAFHPDYETNGFFYVYYTNAEGNLEIARYHVSSNANTADAASKVVVLTIPHPTNANHNGGELHFGADGYLYSSTGDGGGGGDQPNNAQNTAVLLGKMLRLNVNASLTAPFYSIPADNPYGNEIYSLGLRNPFRWSFDRLTNDMWIGDVGQNSYEEINYRAADSTNGTNYGWRCYEGNNAYNTTGCLSAGNYVFPVYTYPNPGGAAITGGLVYRGTASPAIYGWYLAVDFYSGTFYLTSDDGTGGWNTLLQTSTATGISDFGETENGEAYVVSLTSGTVSRIDGAPGSPLPVKIANFTGSVVSSAVELAWQTSAEINLKQFDIEYSLEGNNFLSAGTVAALHAGNGGVYNFNHTINFNGPIFYRLKMIDDNGNASYSGVIRILFKTNNATIVWPTLVTGGIINVNLPENSSIVTAELIRSDGKVILSKNMRGQTGRVNIEVAGLPKGIYFMRFNTGSEALTEKIFIQ